MDDDPAIDPTPGFDLPPARIPERIGEYEILSVLGRGGMGVVYEAEQRSPHRHVALKVLRPGFLDETTWRRFANEGELLGHLHHPGIAQIHQAGIARTADGPVPFFAMELVRGAMLTTHARERSLDTAGRIELLARVCDAVEHAHQKGVVHRDLKPGNILVEEDGQPKVLDFGVARATDADFKATTIETEVGQIIGTLPYMSPEQARGDSASVDARSDVYALGVLLYELLTGRLPYDVWKGSLAEAVRAIQDEEPTSLGAVSSAFRGDIETIVEKALEKESSRRYASAGELGADLRRHLAHTPIVARRASAMYRVRKFAARNRALTAGIATTFAALVLGLVGTSWQAWRASLATKDAEAQTKEAELQAELAEGIRDFLLVDMIKSTDPSADGRDTKVVTLLHRALETAPERFTGDPVTLAAVLDALGGSFHGLGVSALAVEPLESALALRREHRGEDHPETLDTQGRLAEALMGVDRREEALDLANEVAERRRQVLPPDDPRVWSGQSDRAVVVAMNGDLERGYELLETTVREASAAIGPEHPKTLLAKDNLARCAVALGELDVAEELARETYDIRRELLGAGHYETLKSLETVIEVATARGRASDVRELSRQHIDQCVEMHGERNLATARAKLSFAATFFDDDVDELLPLLNDAREIMLERLGDQSWEYLQATTNLARQIERKGDGERALELTRAAVEVARQLYPERVYLSSYLNDLASIHLRLYELEEAREAFSESVRILRAVHPDGMHPILGDTVGNLGLVQRMLGEVDDAVAGFREAERTERALGQNPDLLAADLANLGTTLLVLGDPDWIGHVREAIRERLKSSGVKDEARELAEGILADLEARGEADGWPDAAVDDLLFVRALAATSAGLGFSFDAEFLYQYLVEVLEGDDQRDVLRDFADFYDRWDRPAQAELVRGRLR